MEVLAVLAVSVLVLQTVLINRRLSKVSTLFLIFQTIKKYNINEIQAENKRIEANCIKRTLIKQLYDRWLRSTIDVELKNN